MYVVQVDQQSLFTFKLEVWESYITTNHRKVESGFLGFCLENLGSSSESRYCKPIPWNNYLNKQTLPSNIWYKLKDKMILCLHHPHQKGKKGIIPKVQANKTDTLSSKCGLGRLDRTLKSFSRHIPRIWAYSSTDMPSLDAFVGTSFLSMSTFFPLNSLWGSLILERSQFPDALT